MPTSARAAASQDQLADTRFHSQEFRDFLTFNPEDGRIWLSDTRVMLLDVRLFGALRKQLIDRSSVEEARRFFTQLGYSSGVSDAELVQKRWPDEPARQMAMGPYAFQGIARVEVLRVERDRNQRIVGEEWLWRQCVEADAHIHAFGIGTEPACWMEIGYATGYFSTLSKRLTLFREVACRASGSDVCRVVGRPATEWEDADAELSRLDLPAKRKQQRRPEPPAARFLDSPSVQTGTPGAKAIVGYSPALKAAVQLLRKVAPTDATVLITGESGVGKELFTQTLHHLSRRAERPFVPVNCAAIPDTLIEAELFGVERGAFTGAVQSRAGRFERANGGSLFLDEIGTLNQAAQAKLLRALQEGEIERVGGTRPIKVDVRVIAATNVSLDTEVREGRFREDLFFRLNVFPIRLSPLRERRDDITALAQYFLERYNRRHGKAVPGFSYRAIQALLNYSFPGNIRELENLVERAVILADDQSIDLPHLFTRGENLSSALLAWSRDGKLVQRSQQDVRDGTVAGTDGLAALLLENGGSETAALRWSSVETELLDSLVARAMDRTHGNVSAAARLLGVPRHKVQYHLKKAGARPARR